MWTGMEMDIGWPLTEIRALHHLQVTHTPERTCRYLRPRDFLKCWAFLLVLHHHRHQISDVNIFTKIPESSLLERKSRGQEEGCWQQHRYHDNHRHGCWKRDGKCRAAKKRKLVAVYLYSVPTSLLSFLPYFPSYHFFLCVLFHNSLVFPHSWTICFYFFLILPAFLTFNSFIFFLSFLAFLSCSL